MEIGEESRNGACRDSRFQTRFWRVPTILRVKGYRIGFFSSEPDEPAHVHVVKAGSEAKFWLAPVQISWNKGFRETELREIARILEQHETELIEAWNATE